MKAPPKIEIELLFETHFATPVADLDRHGHLTARVQVTSSMEQTSWGDRFTTKVSALVAKKDFPWKLDPGHEVEEEALAWASEGLAEALKKLWPE